MVFKNNKRSQSFAQRTHITKHKVLYINIYCSKRILKKLIKKKDTWNKVQRKPGTSSKNLVPLKSYKRHLIIPAKYCLPGKLNKDSVSTIFIGGLSCMHLLDMQQNSRLIGKHTHTHTHTQNKCSR